jgi:hypothetical protein
MKPRQFNHDYHDAHLAGFSIGPRREVNLEIALDPVWNNGRKTAHVRLGAIRNFDAVAAFMRSLPPAPARDAYLEAIIRLELMPEKSHPVLLELDRAGHIQIDAAKVSEV